MKVVHDASAILAFIAQEQGALTVAKALSIGFLSSINYSEVYQKLIQKNIPQPKQILEMLERLGLKIVSSDKQDAELAAELWKDNPSFSLADRHCLALAFKLEAVVYTSDKAWNQLVLRPETKLEIVQIR